jgi:uncharacterized membrane protein
MDNLNPDSTMSVRVHFLHAMLVPIPIVCFVATLVTDIVYWRTAAMMWADISAWMLVIGVMGSILAATVGIIDFLANRRIRDRRVAWIHVFGNIAVLVLSIFNTLIHSRDAFTSVVPSGLILSALVVAILLLTGWSGGVRDREPA